MTPEAAADLPPPEPLDLQRAALFLDLDGTIAEIEAVPEKVGPEHRRSSLLERLQAALGGRLAVVSGRSLEDLDRILEGRVIAASGSHGLERRHSEAELWRAEVHGGLDRVAEAFRGFAEANPGVVLETKPFGCGLHYRLAPEVEEGARALAARLAEESGLQLQLGRMMAEVRVPGPHKGDAVRAFMGAPPFAGAVPVFVGDDITDEDAFAVMESLGGHGVLVGPARATAARRRLADVAAVMDWLEGSLAATARP